MPLKRLFLVIASLYLVVYDDNDDDDFNPVTHPILIEKPVGIPTEYPYPQNPEILHTHTPNPVSFRFHAYSLYVQYACCMKIIGLLQCVQNYIYHMFNAFPLNLTSIQNPYRIPIGPMGFITQSPYPSHSHI